MALAGKIRRYVRVLFPGIGSDKVGVAMFSGLSARSHLAIALGSFSAATTGLWLVAGESGGVRPQIGVGGVAGGALLAGLLVESLMVVVPIACVQCNRGRHLCWQFFYGAVMAFIALAGTWGAARIGGAALRVLEVEVSTGAILVPAAMTGFTCAALATAIAARVAARATRRSEQKQGS